MPGSQDPALKRSRPLTLRTVKALDGVAGLEPWPAESIAQRAARVTEQSRRRAQQPAPAVPRNTPAAERHQQTQSPQTPPAPGARLP
ncbi:hypothetical protein AB0950_38630 [Streptomyces sp. NPDC007189]|uniref:hypothetical protein n=1 Tax=unclassified Streptomyces TaxID=2593676 RepID=UPI0033EAB147